VQFVDLVKKNGEGIYAITTWSKYLDNPTNRQYIAAYKAKYNEEPGTDYAQAGYNAIKVLADAINRAGSASDVAKLTEALRKTKVDITTGTLTFDSKGQGSVGVFPMKLENGEFRPVKS
jgi:branched-chain amino acid transport system substrate-binding protein